MVGKIKNILSIVAIAFVCSSAFGTGLFSGEKLSLQLENASLNTVLNIIAEQYQLNLVVSGDIDEKVTIRLDNVDVASALDALLTSNQLNYYINGDIMVIKPIEMDAIGELKSKLVVLKYLDPITAKKALESRKSSKGQIIILDKVMDEQVVRSRRFKPNRILITDFPNILNDLLELVEEIDVPERNISISVKIVETQIDNSSRLGFLWPSSINTNFGSSDDSSFSSSNLTGNAIELDPNTGGWTWGKLNVEQLTVLLDFLSQNDNTRLISDPHLIVTENYEAEIRSETIIPIQTINRFSEGTSTSDIVTFEDEEVGISLKVTPRINEEGRITLEVQPKVENILGFSGPPDNQKPIKSSRSIRTRVTVSDGETLALGGLLSEEEMDQEQKVPLLGSIPLLGKWLFTHHTKQRKTSDLLILITPTIVN